MSTRRAAVVSFSLLAMASWVVAQSATVVDFETFPTNVECLSNGQDEVITAGVARFSGGQVARLGTSPWVLDDYPLHTNFYTALWDCQRHGAFLDTITITFAEPVKNFSVQVAVSLGEPGNEVIVQDNLGATVAVPLGFFATALVALPSTGISSVTIRNRLFGEGLGIDNVAFEPAGCTDERATISEEYTDFNVELTPDCEDFTQTRAAVHFAFGELNTGDYTWALIRDPLVIAAETGYGLDRWRVEFGAPRIINSAYRNPSRNARVGGAGQSRHMYGDAVDLRNESGDRREYLAMRFAARRANADYIEPQNGPCRIACTHADWRNHAGVYQP